MSLSSGKKISGCDGMMVVLPWKVWNCCGGQSVRYLRGEKNHADLDSSENNRVVRRGNETTHAAIAIKLDVGLLDEF
jgi:hypothetical protein